MATCVFVLFGQVVGADGAWTSGCDKATHKHNRHQPFDVQPNRSAHSAVHGASIPDNLNRAPELGRLSGALCAGYMECRFGRRPLQQLTFT